MLHPVAEGTIFSKETASGDTQSIVISKADVTATIRGGDGYWYRKNSAGRYTIYYRCVDMKFDKGIPGPNDDIKGQGQLLDFFEERDDLIIKKFLTYNPPEGAFPGLFGHQFELFLSDPKYGEVMEIDPYSVWAFNITVIATLQNYMYKSGASFYNAFGVNRGALQTTIMKTSGGIAYPGLVDTELGFGYGPAALGSAVVFSNAHYGHDEMTYDAGAPLDALNLPIRINKHLTPEHYMENLMGDDEDGGGFQLFVDAGSTSVPDDAMSILPSHKDYLRLKIQTKVPCRVVARVELTQLAGVEAFVGPIAGEWQQENEVVELVKKTVAFEEKAINHINKLEDGIKDSVLADENNYDIGALKALVGDKKMGELSMAELREFAKIKDATKGASLEAKKSVLENREITVADKNNRLLTISALNITADSLNVAAQESIIAGGFNAAVSSNATQTAAFAEEVATAQANLADAADSTPSATTTNDYLDYLENASTDNEEY
jgi:hypothetical protein